ncbi:MAG TPA: SusE domain-containing protein [Chitinophagaceae bacterium]|nr:SusE domain-containing protein [Chitinophagaceae bacterium]
MKNIAKLFMCIAGAAVVFMACNKVAPLAHYNTGTPTVLSSSATTIAPTPADSLSTVVTFSWTSPNYATDSSTVKYIVQIDSSGKDFSKAAQVTVTGDYSVSLTAKQLNTMLLGLGFNYNQTYSVDVRILSSYANNNDQQISNTLTLTVTPYVVPPKVAPPASKMLFLVGSATAGGWGNPVPVPSQQFTELDSVTYQGTFYLNGGQEYLLLPVDGDWSHKYAVADKTVSGLNAGGDFGADLSDNIPGPATTGMYQITVDFQHGKFTVTQVKQYGLLYVPGDYQGWNPASAPTLGSPNNDGNYDGYVNIPAGGSYEFKLTPGPTWDNALGDGGGGTLSTSGGNLKVSAGGYYHITANTVSNTWSATATTWSLIGSFSASGWSNDVDMTYDAGSNSWKGTITTAEGDQFKFRANHDWGLNYGDNGGGSLQVNGSNIGDAGHNQALPAGTHTITLFLNNAGYYTYMIQ